MRALLAGLLFIAAGTAAGATSPSPIAPPAPTPTQQTPPPQPAICCCRVYARGWQYSWLSPQVCQQNNGTCVSPDHC